MNTKINPWYITGLVDAEGSFIVNIIKDNTRKSGYNILVYFSIALNNKDKALLDEIKSVFGVGNIFYNTNDKTYKLKVSKIDDINNVIIPFFKKYYLITQKRIDFELFTKIIEIINCKDHLVIEGLQNIVNIKASMNKGISDKIKQDFINTVAVSRPNFNVLTIPDSNWLSGFSEGESCFFVSIYKSSKSKLGSAVQLVFKITQHSRDIELLNCISKFLGCGRVEKRAGEACDFTVTSFKAFDEKIIPFFNSYPLFGSKALDLKDFRKVFNIMKVKGHLTEEGLIEIRKIKDSMNTNRYK